MQDQQSKSRAISTLKRIASVILGAALLILAIGIWVYATKETASLVESFWCNSIEHEAVCRFRGYQQFLIWSVAAIVNLLIVGFLYDRISRVGR